MDTKDRRVKVIVRIRPTQKFAYDVINLQPDGKVRTAIFITILNYNIHLF